MQLCRALHLPLLGVALAGCAEDAAEPAAQAGYQPLVELADFQRVPLDRDPFVGDETPEECVGKGFFLENGWLEIDTGLCNWVTIEAASQQTVKLEQQVQVVVSHFDLGAIAPAEAELYLRFDDCEAWQKVVAIPGAAARYDEKGPSRCRLDEGDLIQFHLHNHGQNTWQLQQLSVLR